MTKALEKQGIRRCGCDALPVQLGSDVPPENMPGVPPGVAAQDALSSDKKQDVLEGVRGSGSKRGKERPVPDSTADMRDMRDGVPIDAGASEPGETLLQPEVLRGVEGTEPGDSGAPSKHSRQQQRQEAAIQRAKAGEESGMEGRSNLQAEQGQLHRPEVPQMSAGIPADGAQGRVHNGTSLSDGEAPGAAPESDGSGASQGPQHSEQFDRQSATLLHEWGAQACRRCGGARIPDGLGTALKPSYEPWTLARKPLSEKNVAQNVLKHSTGALNIDGCRVGLHDGDKVEWRTTHSEAGNKAEGWRRPWMADTDDFNARNAASVERANAQGRWPPNLLLSHHPDCKPTGEVRRVGNGEVKKSGKRAPRELPVYGGGPPTTTRHAPDNYGTEPHEVWICHESCPIRLLDEMSGQVRSSGHFERGSKYKGSKEGAASIPIDGDLGATYSDKGGASRFFPRFASEYEQHEVCHHNHTWACRCEKCIEDGCWDYSTLPDEFKPEAPFRYVAKASRAERNKGLSGAKEAGMVNSHPT